MMMNRIKLVFLLIFCIFLNACAHAPLDVDFKPALSSSAVANANRAPLKLWVNDKRDTDSLGNRDFGNRGGQIYAKQNLSLVLLKSMSRMAETNNFMLDKTGRASISVNLLALHFAAIDSFSGNELIAESAIEVIAVRDGQRVHRIYHGADQSEYTHTYVGDAQIQKELNGALTKALNKIALDQNLWQFLIGKYTHETN